ncbi:MAG: BamA/TamA family outer membrane protein [Polyangiaceae bacterium]|nr:BamA/TamA family outer membrane protein [Polyangiaceae bacterium]
MTAFPSRPARAWLCVQELAAIIAVSLCPGVVLAQPTETALPAGEQAAPIPSDAVAPSAAPDQPRGEPAPALSEPAPAAPPAAEPAASTASPVAPTAARPRALPGAAPRAPAPAAPRRASADEATPLRYMLEGIELRGNERTRARVVLRYLPFRPGEVFDVDDPRVELARYRLLGTGFFRDVQFSLRKGSRRGSVVLVVDLAERNTVVVNNVWMGLSADADTRGRARPLTAYTGLDVAETNLAGTGMTLGSALGLAQDQFALRVRFLDPAFLATEWMVDVSLLYNDANDFFGNAGVRASPQVTNSAVVQYRRFGGSLGVGRDLSVSSQVWAHYRLESIDAAPPLAASHVRGGEREPILIDVIRGQSVLSAISGTLRFDTRDHPFLPTQGWFSNLTGEFALLPLGSHYDYQRIDLYASHWWTLPWHKHVVRLELFVGTITGDAPFFEQYYVGDFSDFLPARVLGLNVDRRPSPNLLGTSIEEVRYGQYAAKIKGEYRIPLYRGRHSVYGIDLYGSAGMFGLAHRRDLLTPPRNYSGLAQVPVDVTADIGVRMDTTVGGVALAFSNVLGFIPVRGNW